MVFPPTLCVKSFSHVTWFHFMMKSMLFWLQFNPLVPIAHKSARIGKISILKLEGIIKKKNSYERRDYESVDEKSLS